MHLSQYPSGHEEDHTPSLERIETIFMPVKPGLCAIHTHERQLKLIHRAPLALAAFLSAATAQAAECEDSFTKRGNPVTGLKFTATRSVDGMSAPSAIGQLRGIVVGKGYDVLAAEPETGTMLIEQPATGKARSFPIEIQAADENGAGKVQMHAKLRPTMNIPEAGAKTEMCGILNQLRGGKAGLALAARGNAAKPSQSAAPLRMSVLAFSSQMGNEARRNAPALQARHKGKTYTIWGTVGYVGPAGSSYRVDYKLLDNALISLTPGTGYRLEVSCILAAGQSAFAMGLKPDKRVELTGVFDEYDEGRSTVYLRDCRPVKK